MSTKDKNNPKSIQDHSVRHEYDDEWSRPKFNWEKTKGDKRRIVAKWPSTYEDDWRERKRQIEKWMADEGVLEAKVQKQGTVDGFPRDVTVQGAHFLLRHELSNSVDPNKPEMAMVDNNRFLIRWSPQSVFTTTKRSPKG